MNCFHSLQLHYDFDSEILTAKCQDCGEEAATEAVWIPPTDQSGLFVNRDHLPADPVIPYIQTLGVSRLARTICSISGGEFSARQRYLQRITNRRQETVNLEMADLICHALKIHPSHVWGNTW